MKKLLDQIIKFGIIGIIATIVDWGIFAALVELYKAKIGIEDWINLEDWKLVASTISFSVSVIVNYIGSMKFVFERRDDMSRKKEFVIFMILSIMGLLINLFIVWVLRDVEEWFKDWPAIISRFAYMLPKVVATAVVLVWNFITRKIFLEKKE